MLLVIGQFALGIVYGQGLEWSLHKFLHTVGRKRSSRFAYHLHAHHRASRENLFHDASYRGEGDGPYKEIRDVCLLVFLHLPVLFVLPAFFAGSCLQAALYFFVHRQAHLDPEWCKRYVPWHYDHHMARNQDANWGVTTCWIDHLVGTREVYLGTEREQKDTLRRLERRKLSS